MKEIIIYPTSVLIGDDVTVQDIYMGFMHEILNKSVEPIREREIIERYAAIGINIRVIVVPDGYTDEELLDRTQLAEDIVSFRQNLENLDKHEDEDKKLAAKIFIANSKAASFFNRKTGFLATGKMTINTKDLDLQTLARVRNGLVK